VYFIGSRNAVIETRYWIRFKVYCYEARIKDFEKVCGFVPAHEDDRIFEEVFE